MNSIEYAARLICFIRDIAEEMRDEGPRDEYFDTPFSTAQTGKISGGTGTNIIPQLCEFDFEFRNLPQVEASTIMGRIVKFAEQELLPKMKAEQAEAKILFETIAEAPGLSASEDAEVTQLVRALTRDNGSRKVSYGTEGGQFQAAGIPAIICGPGSIEQAHSANEWVELSQISACESFLDKFLHRQKA